MHNYIPFYFRRKKPFIRADERETDAVATLERFKEALTNTGEHKPVLFSPVPDEEHTQIIQFNDHNLRLRQMISMKPGYVPFYFLRNRVPKLKVNHTISFSMPLLDPDVLSNIGCEISKSEVNKLYEYNGYKIVEILPQDKSTNMLYPQYDKSTWDPKKQKEKKNNEHKKRKLS